ncbi:conserved exported hypothetical protein [Verrucomicrobia bacterium]|nr:conserved exported hypothetical protein [Verrucomicrobiota bacterium]
MIPVLLLLLFSLALSIGAGFLIIVIRRGHRAPPAPPASSDRRPVPSIPRPSFARRPSCWLAVKSRNLLAVQCALGLNNPKPCSWLEGLCGEEKLFIAPPVKGWILVVGSDLPDPSEDVDACFRFVLEVSRKLGHVQFFSASRILHHHAWVQADGGRVVRAYAWAGRTLWKQGRPTTAEKELEVKCFDYTESAERNLFGQPDVIAANVEKVPMLAARWSLDPARIEERFLEKERGVAGEPSHRF